VFIEAKDDGGGGDNWTTGAISRAKLQSNHHHQQTNSLFSTGRLPFMSPNQQCQSTSTSWPQKLDRKPVLPESFRQRYAEAVFAFVERSSTLLEYFAPRRQLNPWNSPLLLNT